MLDEPETVVSERKAIRNALHARELDTNDRMLLSIVIPSCGREEVVDAINSCLRQQLPTHACFEIVLVDNTAEGRLLATAAAYGGPVRWIHEPNQGVSQARNAGVREARGTFAFLDDDEEASPGWAAAEMLRACRGRKTCRSSAPC